MKLANCLILLLFISCGSKNNIFYSASKSISKTIGAILPAEVEPDFNILAPAINSKQGQFVTINGECSDTTKLEISNPQLEQNPVEVECIDEKYTAQVKFTNLADIITELEIKAINKTKSTSKSLELEVKLEKPTIASYIDLSYIRSSLAKLAWNASSSTDLPFLHYELEYKKKSQSDWEITKTTQVEAIISSLDPSTEYDFRVRAFNGNYSNYSSTSAATMPNNTFFEENKIKAINIGRAQKSSIVAIQAGDFYLNGNLVATLQVGETHKFNSSPYDILSSSSAFFVAGIRGSGSNVKKGNIVWTTQDWSSRKLNFAVSRAQAHKLSIVAFENSNVEIKKGTSLVSTHLINADNGIEVTLPSNGSYTIESTGAVSAYVISTKNSTNIEDPRPILPASRDIIGYPSRWGYISALINGTNSELFHSNDISSNHTFTNSANYLRVDSQGDKYLYKGEALRILSSEKIVANSNADRNGNCSAPFIPRAKMRTTYAVNVESEWVAFASAQAGTITITKANGQQSTITLSKSGSNQNSPFKARLANVEEGTIFTSTVPMGAWYEPKNDSYGANDDETILFGFNL